MTVRMIMTRLRRRLTRKTLVSVLVQLAVALAGLAIAYSNYLFFHSLAELFTVIIAAVIFLFVWNSRDFITDRYVLFLGIAYLFVGGIDLVHVLSFKGMQVLTWSATADAATRLWILARALEVASLLAAVKLGSNFREGRLLFGYLVFTILGLLSIRYGIFPVCYQEGVGLTPFKIVSEYVITVGLFAALVLYWRERRRF
ncbi:MAG: PAS domain-containing sensor histidine kinase, partial [Oligoflexia bacterium]|nr:PAS domain-containing sensor histidine kinase [Oligoflexia bacterium]